MKNNYTDREMGHLERWSEHCFYNGIEHETPAYHQMMEDMKGERVSRRIRSLIAKTLADAKVHHQS